MFVEAFAKHLFADGRLDTIGSYHQVEILLAAIAECHRNLFIFILPYVCNRSSKSDVDSFHSLYKAFLQCRTREKRSRTESSKGPERPNFKYLSMHIFHSIPFDF